MPQRDDTDQRNYQQPTGYDTPRQAQQWDQDSQRPTQPNRDDYARDRDMAHSRDVPSSRMTSRLMSGEPRQGEYRVRRDTRSDLDRSRQSRVSAQSEYIPHDYDASGGNSFNLFTSEDYGGRDFYNNGRPAAGMASSESYRPTYGRFSSGVMASETMGHRHHDDTESYHDWRRYGEHRGFLQRTGDEIASWFGDDEAAARRKADHRGRGPADYTRSDERIREDVNDALTHDRHLDARTISVVVEKGEVTLNGTVDARRAKRHAEDIADSVSGVRHVQNNLRISEDAHRGG